MKSETFTQMAERHLAADMLVQTKPWEDGKGSSVGCFNHDFGNNPGSYAALAASTGYPAWAHRLQDEVFDGLTEAEAGIWHVQFANACEQVTDWTAHYHKTMIGILRVAEPHDTSGVVASVIALHQRGADVSKEEWLSAADAADAADGALAAARAAGWAARAARAAAVTAVWAARASAAAARAEESAWRDIRDAFLGESA